jgi:hypothetical protein
VDKPTVTVELGKTDMVTATLTASGGYSGTVNVAATAVDASNNAINGVTVTAAATATLATNGTATVPVMIQVAPNATGAQVQATLKIDVTAGPDPVNLTPAVTISNVFTVIYPDGAGAVVANHLLRGANITVKRGATIRFKNEDTTPGITHITHGDGAFPHESLAKGQFGDVYDVATNGIPPGSTGQLGCHDHESGSTYLNFTVQ